MNDAIKKAHERRLQMKAEGVEVERLDPIEKAKRNPTSRRLAINAKCWGCSCGQRVEIRECTVTACPLWNFRPYQTKEENSADEN
jgi:hypothetical protein